LPLSILIFNVASSGAESSKHKRLRSENSEPIGPPLEHSQPLSPGFAGYNNLGGSQPGDGSASPKKSRINETSGGASLYEPFPRPIIIETEHAERRRATAAAWAELLPRLVYPLMQWKHNKGRETSSWKQTCPCAQKEKVVNVISFTCMFTIEPWILRPDPWNLAISELRIAFCQHSPPAVSLVRMGAFSSTPIKPPMWAFDIVLLEYMSQHFAYGTPDVTAWCNATSSFLSGEGVEKVPSPVCFFFILWNQGSQLILLGLECSPPPRSVSLATLSAGPRPDPTSGPQCDRQSTPCLGAAGPCSQPSGLLYKKQPPSATPSSSPPTLRPCSQPSRPLYKKQPPSAAPSSSPPTLSSFPTPPLHFRCSINFR
jgi:hypothetical protein